MHLFAVLDDIQAKLAIALIIEGDATGAERLGRRRANAARAGGIGRAVISST